MKYKGSAPEEEEEAPAPAPKPAPKPAADVSKVSSILAKIKSAKKRASQAPKKKIDQSLINSGAEIVVD